MARESIGTSGVSSSRPGDDTQEMKKVLQSIIMNECSDLFQLYDFRLVQLSAQRNDYLDGYSFTAGVMSPRVDGGKTLYVQHALARTTIFDESFRYNASQSLACSNAVMHLCHQLARKLRHEVELKTKEMPVVAHNPFSPYNTYTTSLTAATIMSQMPTKPIHVNEDDIMSFSNPIKKTSKFEHIDNLISDAKKRLYGGYAKPVLAFQYF